MKYPETINGTCSNCGGRDMVLAEDFTTYSPCEWSAEWGWGTMYTSDRESSGADEAVRFFCTNCGTQHAVPEELP